jgi:hypothetical protein
MTTPGIEKSAAMWPTRESFETKKLAALTKTSNSEKLVFPTKSFTLDDEAAKRLSHSGEVEDPTTTS